MATIQMIKPKKTDFKVDVDVLLKPELALKSAAHSTTFMKQMIAVSISSICYMRNLFPKEYFRFRQLGNLQVQVLRNMKHDPTTTRFLKWIEGSFEAMEKGYLRDIIFGVQLPGEDDFNKAVESYIFRIKYTDNGQSDYLEVLPNNSHVINFRPSQVSSEQLEQNIIGCITECAKITRNMPTLPEGCTIGVILTYYPETPDEYEPPGFRAGKFADFEYPPGHAEFRIGKFVTPYHSVKMKGFAEEHEDGTAVVSDTECTTIMESPRSSGEMPGPPASYGSPHSPMQTHTLMGPPQVPDLPRFNLDKSNVSGSSKSPEIELSPAIMSRLGSSASSDHPLKRNDPNTSCPLPFLQHDTEVSRPQFNTQLAGEEAFAKDTFNCNNQNSENADSGNNTFGDVTVTCVCEIDTEFDIMICCMNCNAYSHGACYGYLNKPPLIYRHICIRCSERNENMVCTDFEIARVSRTERLKLAFLRRALCYCERHVQFRLEILIRDLEVPEHLVSWLINKLEKSSALKVTTSHQPPMTIKRGINKRALTKLCKQYFPRQDEYNFAEPLVDPPIEIDSTIKLDEYTTVVYQKDVHDDDDDDEPIIKNLPMADLQNLNSVKYKNNPADNVTRKRVFDSKVFKEMCLEVPSKKQKTSSGRK